MLYYVKLTDLSIKTIFRPLPSLVRDAIIKFSFYFNIGYKLKG